MIDIKFSRQKIISKERTVIKTTFKTFQYSFVLLRRSRCFFNEHKLPARANGTKREAVWYSELYLPFFDICGTYKARKIGNDKRRRSKIIKNIARIRARRTRRGTIGGRSSSRTRAEEKRTRENSNNKLKGK